MPSPSLFRALSVALLVACCVAGFAALPVEAQAQAPNQANTTPEQSCSAVSTPDQKKDEDTIRRIEQGWLTAEYQGNPRFLDCLLEPDYRTSGRDGKIRTRESVIDYAAHASNPTRAVPQLESIVFVHGDVSAAHSILRKTDKDGNPKEVHFVDTYVFHDGRWHAFGGADL